jgi:toxin ParE1/3/4
VSRLKFTLLARQDFQDIGDYIAKDNLRAALSFVQRLEGRCLSLSQNPRIGRKRDEVRPNLRSATEGDYLIFYRPLADGIEVMRVVHGSRDTRKILFSDQS